MYIEKVKADHDSTWTAYECYEESTDITEEQPEDNRRLEKTISDYIKVIRPGILVSADEAIFQHELLAGLQFHRATPKATVASLIDDVLRTRARTIVLVDPPAVLDADELIRRTRCYCLTLKSGGAA